MSVHLMIPGPTPLPAAVLQAMSRPMINHRSPAFTELYREVEHGVQWLCQTQNQIVMLAGSGTTGMEAALCNFFSAGDPVLAVTQGSFSERFGKMAETFGLETDYLSYEWGQVPTADDLEAQLKQKSYRAVLMVHNETSSGTLNPLAELARVCQQYGALSIVDAISSLSSTPLLIDEWGLDVVITASQKGYYAPPGLSILAISERAWEYNQTARLPRFTLDLQLTREYALQGITPWTPPLTVFYALQAGFKLLQAEGLEQIQQRHLQLMRVVRAGLQALNLRLLVPDEHIASRCVTPVYPPPGLEADQIRAQMLAEHQIILGAGLRKMTGQVFRIGHLGDHDLSELFGVLNCLELCLQKMGHPLEPGCAIAAANQSL